MQSVSGTFNNNSAARIRKLYWKFLAAFEKDYLTSVNFFTIGVSSIGGSHIIKGNGSVVQEWDKYLYKEYSNRIVSFEYTRQQDPYLGGGIMSMADIILSNHDGLFTPNNPTSPLGNYMLPYRPVRLYAGFGTEALQVFIGLIEGMPDVDDKNKTVKLHCIDFMSDLFDYPLDEALILENYRTDEVIAELLEMAGILTSQYNLDTGLTTIPFFFAEKGSKLGDHLRGLAAAEMGRIYMDEDGVIRFINRSNWLNNTTPVWTFNQTNIIERRTTKTSNIINVVEVKSTVRETQEKQRYWQLTTPVAIPAGEEIDIWADFSDPITEVDDPEYLDDAETSYYRTNTHGDNSGEALNSYINVKSVSKFSKSVKMTFENTHSSTAIFITDILLYAIPAKISKKIYARVEDTSSVAKYLERPVTIENNFIQDESTADSIARIIIEDNKEYNPYREIDVMGVPQLQVGDLVRITDEKFSDIYFVTKIVGKMSGAKFIQTLTVIKKTINQYFRIGISTIGGTHPIGP